MPSEKTAGIPCRLQSHASDFAPTSSAYCTHYSGVSGAIPAPTLGASGAAIGTQVHTVVELAFAATLRTLAQKRDRPQEGAEESGLRALQEVLAAW